MKDVTRINLATGAFVLIVFLSVTGLMLYLQVWDPAPKGDPYTLVFENAPGVQAKAGVMIGGKKVGEVHLVKVAQDKLGEETAGKTQTVVHVNIVIYPGHNKRFTIYKNAYATITTNVFGKSTVELKPGGKGHGGEDETGVIPVGGFIKGLPPTTIDDMAKEAANATRQVADLAVEVRNFIGDNRLQEHVRGTIARANEVMDELSEAVDEIRPALREVGPAVKGATQVLTGVNALIEENRIRISQTIANLDEVSNASKELLKDGRAAKLGEALDGMVASMGRLSTAADTLIANNRGHIDEILANMRDTTAQVRDLATRIKMDPSIVLWGTDDQVSPEKSKEATVGLRDEFKLRNSGRLPPRERD